MVGAGLSPDDHDPDVNMEGMTTAEASAAMDQHRRNQVKKIQDEKPERAFGSPQPAPPPDVPAPAAAAPDAPVPEVPAPVSPEVNPAKQLDFNNSNIPSTPVTPVMVGARTEELDYNAFIVDTLLWKNKIRSSFYFVAGCLAWVVFRAIFTSPTTVTTGACYTLLASLILNFFRGVLAPRYQERCTWAHSAVTRFLSAASTTTIAAAAALHDRYLNGLDPVRTVVVGLGLWVLSFLGRALDVVTILLLLHLGAFSLPLLYSTNKQRINAAAADVYAKANAQYQKLDRRLRAAIVLGPLTALLFLLPNIDRLVAVFIILAYGRALAKPDEYAFFQKRIEPVGKTITNTVVTPLSKAATSAMNKYDITPTPSKKRS